MDKVTKLKYYALCLRSGLVGAHDILNYGAFMELFKQLNIFLDLRQIQGIDLSKALQDDTCLSELKADLKRTQAGKNP